MSALLVVHPGGRRPSRQRSVAMLLSVGASIACCLAAAS
jgi:hypothetical protein